MYKKLTHLGMTPYARVRRFLPALLRTIRFDGTPAGLDGKDDLVVTPLDRLDEPDSLVSPINSLV
jgi:hypothetical protein